MNLGAREGRVKERVARGGHSIPEDTIQRRFYRGLKNLLNFLSIVDVWMIADNSGQTVSLIAEGKNGFESTIYNDEVWNKIKNSDG